MCLTITFLTFLVFINIANGNQTPTEKYYSRFEHYDIDFDVMAQEKEEFLNKYSPNGEYGYNNTIETLVATELQDRLDDKIFFDYTANGVYFNSQIDKVFSDLKHHFYANTHSQNDFSSRTDDAVHEVRQLLLKHFNTTSSDYTVIFTAGATAGLKLVGESFPWTNNSKFMYLRQNHNSVLGIREYALQQNATFKTVTAEALNSPKCEELFTGSCNDVPFTSTKPTLTTPPNDVYNLFAFPALDNFAGVKYPLNWIEKFRKHKTGKNDNWLVLLDAAAYLSSNKLDLSKYPADFVVMSFYKLFGYPTGIGALLVKNEVIDIMQKSFFGGGTVIMSDCDSHFCLLHNSGCQRFEDGSVSYLNIHALKYGLEVLNTIGINNIGKHVMSITDYLYDELISLRHSTGKPVVEIYGLHHLKDHKKQGQIINFSVFNKNGSYIGYNDIQFKANKAGFQVRAGSSCNPGACYGYLGVTSEEVTKFSLERESCGDEHDIMEGKPLGGVRLSLGILSTFEEVYSFVQFMKSNYVN
ncbi:Molybdenum cofactor sulfurase [Entamoeba marina]